MVGFGVPDDIYLGNEDNAANSHSKSNDREVNFRKFQWAHLDMFFTKDIAPQEAGK